MKWKNPQIWSMAVRNSAELQLKEGCALIKVTSKCWHNLLLVLKHKNMIPKVGIIQIIISQKFVKTTA